MTLPTDHKARKGIPIYSGLLKYFPDACAAVAELSRVANEQHNPGEPMHWAREKSTDHHDCLVRHAMQAGTRDTDGIRHSTKVAWRALAIDQLEAEADAKPKRQNLTYQISTVGEAEKLFGKGSVLLDYITGRRPEMAPTGDPAYCAKSRFSTSFDLALNHYQSVPIYHA